MLVEKIKSVFVRGLPFRQLAGSPGSRMPDEERLENPKPSLLLREAKGKPKRTRQIPFFGRTDSFLAQAAIAMQAPKFHLKAQFAPNPLIGQAFGSKKNIFHPFIALSKIRQYNILCTPYF
ncbi:MAG: hypothetical protein ACI4QT_09440 [Kiritimatiellia bacterium]